MRYEPHQEAHRQESEAVAGIHFFLQIHVLSDSELHAKVTKNPPNCAGAGGWGIDPPKGGFHAVAFRTKRNISPCKEHGINGFRTPFPAPVRRIPHGLSRRAP